MPVAWLARVRCAAFWFRILSNPLYEGKILRVAAMEAIECGGPWVMKLQGVLSHLGSVVLELRRYGACPV